MMMHRPGTIAAAGPTKADGSPNMSDGANIRVRDMLKPPAIRFPLDGEGGYREAPSDTEIARDIAAQLRMAAAAIAPFLAWILLILALALFHENLMTAARVTLTLLGHAGIASVGGLWGGNATDYSNVTLFELATSPANVLVETYQGNIVGQAVISCFLILIAAYMGFFGRSARRAWNLIYRFVKHHTVIIFLAIFIWWYVVQASAATAPTMSTIQRRGLLPDIADRCGGRFITRCHMRCAHYVAESACNVTFVDFTPEGELIAVLGAEKASSARVWDTGARRHVVRSTDRMIKGTIRPCNFTVRGINTGGMQPRFMGDVEALLPLRGGTVEHCVLKGAVCIEQSLPTTSSAPAFSRTMVCATGAVASPTGARCTLRITDSYSCPTATTDRPHMTSTRTATVSCSWASAGASIVSQRRCVETAPGGSWTSLSARFDVASTGLNRCTPICSADKISPKPRPTSLR